MTHHIPGHPASLVQFVGDVPPKKAMPSLYYEALGVYLPLITVTAPC